MSSSYPGKIIDAYCHFSFLKVIDFLEQHGRSPHMFRRLFSSTPTLIDIDRRIELMNKCNIARSVLVPLPGIETEPAVYNNPKLSHEVARIFNDALAEIVAQYPNQLSGVALLPTTSREAMTAELERAVRQRNFVGGFLVVGPTVKPPDHPDYEYLYKKAVDLDVPLWLHPSRPPNYPDYDGEPASKYQVWQTLSWLMDSSTAMVRIVFSGVFQRYPSLKLIIHHHGALIPLFADRMEYGWDFFEKSTGQKQPTTIEKPYIDHFKHFYCDTATQGKGSALLELSYNFFGVDRLLFASDAPMDATGGIVFTQTAKESVMGMKIDSNDRNKIFQGNAMSLLKLKD